LIGQPLRLCSLGRELRTVFVCCPSPDPGTHWSTGSVHALLCSGRYEGTERFLSRRDSPEQSLHSSSSRRENRNTCVVQPRRGASQRPCRQHTLPEADDAQPEPRRKKWAKSAFRGSRSLDNGGPHKCSAEYATATLDSGPSRPRPLIWERLAAIASLAPRVVGVGVSPPARTPR
jgi:hypothetical protein